MVETVICVVDRVEEGIAVCIADSDGRILTFRAEEFGPVREGDALALTVAQETVTAVRPAREDEHEDKKAQNAARLRRLFDKSK